MDSRAAPRSEQTSDLTGAADVKINVRIYQPRTWAELDLAVQKRFRQVEEQLRVALNCKQPTYDELATFVYKPSTNIKVRQTVADAVRKRTKRSYSMTHEIACFRKAVRESTYRTGRTLYESAAAVRKHLFGHVEPLRTFNMTISYHSKWMSIVPPAIGDPIFLDLDRFRQGPALFGALNIYLILLTSHPYSDGNGRTSRLMFNLHLAEALAMDAHYIPISELTRASAGVYEECIASACLHGNFRQLIWLMLALLEAYAQHLERPSAHEISNDLARVLSLATTDTSEKGGCGINEMPPFPISVQCFSRPEPGSEINQDFLDATLSIAGELSAYGSIQFAMTGLADLSPAVYPRTGAIVFFIDAIRKEDLLLRFRELRAKYSRRLRLQVAIASNNPVMDAKLLVTMVTHYTAKDPTATSCPILLHDFDSISLENA